MTYDPGEGPITEDEAKEHVKHIDKHDPKPEKVDTDLDDPKLVIADSPERTAGGRNDG